ncbi:MAG: hypothetical protein Q8K86_05935 [Candidatus Nanopelagicaceae bacterium]|nr:hypothetical protein [Candidatus Nanopelagicaceae bacterium]
MIDLRNTPMTHPICPSTESIDESGNQRRRPSRSVKRPDVCWDEGEETLWSIYKGGLRITLVLWVWCLATGVLAT